ncbi:MAG TPA: thiamine-phosphate kinase [Burkholderiales bacterium]|nr:thiamine-phosphate kinase [Burkholderiales bacterium]
MDSSAVSPEFDLIARYFTRAPRHAALGVGDDAALISVSAGNELAASTDMLVEGVHFFADVDAQSLGHKALAVNLSDLAAMGATPRWAMLSLALPGIDAQWLEKFSRGFFALADKHGVDLVGGDTTRGPRNICVQIMGEVPKGSALRRDHARIGDDIWVSGTLGDAAAAVAHRRGELTLEGATLERCRNKLDWPAARVALGVELLSLANSAIDISDGLLGDLGHICERSGVGARVVLDDVPCMPDLRALREQDRVRRAVLAGGDDYELCFTALPQRTAEIAALAATLDLPLTRIGSIVEGNAVLLVDAAGRAVPMKETGFDHFR